MKGGSVFVRAALLGGRGFNYRLGRGEGCLCEFMEGCTTKASGIEWVISG